MTLLKQYLIANPLHDLSKVVAHKTFQNIKFNSNEMAGYLLSNDAYSYFMDFTNDIQRATADRIKAVSNFDFSDSEDGIENKYMLQVLINIETAANNTAMVTNLTNLQTLLLANAIKETAPFVGTTQAEMDAVKAEIALMGELESYNTSYADDNDAVEMNKLKADELQFDVIYDEPVTVDCTAKLFCEYLITAKNKWFRIPHPITTLQYSVGEDHKHFRSNQNYGSRKIRFVAVSNVKLPLSVDVLVS